MQQDNSHDSSHSAKLQSEKDPAQTTELVNTAGDAERGELAQNLKESSVMDETVQPQVGVSQA